MADTGLRLGLFRRWYKICHTYVHQSAIGGGTNYPYEQLTPTSPMPYLFYLDKINTWTVLNDSNFRPTLKMKAGVLGLLQLHVFLILMSGLHPFWLFIVKQFMQQQ